ncbi:rhomboid family intramembrane serine protease [Pseudonocardia endophytica]|uniref:rhomboid family intramembrane serine protease n=1 Tax=Pseudonocardia endophytica TaxID=401976 RepID=UPI00104BD6D0|nr:rhomboid family intramembrane serine protease [Pseudonocardia endophytica]
MSAAPEARRPVARVLPPAWRAAAMTMLVFTAVLYLAEVVDVASGNRLDAEGAIQPHSVDGLLGILTAPLLHSGWAHLIGNTVPFLVFGFLAMAGGFVQWFMVTATVWVASGLGVWLFSTNATIGVSGVIFGWFVFLLVRGFFVRSFGQIALAVALFVIYGSLLWGVLPSDPMISWQAHLFGALGGLLAGYLVGRADRPTRAVPPADPFAGGVTRRI